MNLPGSEMADAKRAQNVCHACVLRKKACDKALPACGFCASRQLLCRYDTSALKSQSRRRHRPGKHFVPLQLWSPPVQTVTQPLPSPESQQSHTPILPFNFYILPQSIDESLYELAQHFTKLSNLTCDSIIDRYFLAIHKCLPVISPESFRREAVRYREEGHRQPADFTVLLLAMLLNIIPTVDSSLRPPRASQELLYRGTKFAFSQAQASNCTSLRLVQAALLIALREYTFVRPKAAYVSLMTCAGMAQVVRIGVLSTKTPIDVQNTSDSRFEDGESESLGCAIAMLERYDSKQQIIQIQVNLMLNLRLRLILCEMDRRDLQPYMEYQGLDWQLPSDPMLNSKPGSNLETFHQARFSSLTAGDDGRLKRQALSISLLDQLLSVRRRITINKESKLTELAELAELDSKIRCYLRELMSQLEPSQILICFHVALCVR